MFVVSYYVVMFVHIQKIYKYRQNIYLFYVVNYVSLYIMILLLQIVRASTDRLMHKMRNFSEITEESLDEMFNPFFTDKILMRRIEVSKTCGKCYAYMPPRTHHCRICDACFTKMDHHCFFLNVCIGLPNYKYYYLFLLINWIYSTFLFILLLYFAIAVKQTPNRMTFYVIGIISNCIILVITFIFLLFHTRLLLYNETTIERLAINEFLAGDDNYKGIFQEGLLSTDEQIDIRDRKLLNPYFLGYKENIREVFGDRYYEWIMPYFTSRSNGIYFRKNN
ncbi:putative DHHC-type Zn-finger protein [Trachipleistophora hominis]|uniref:Palmitoyltransferase n=1 Tax=Trachipleistophora hominis TaxID=72359 RepID=L7JY86_TRAHO|nr:putative DHHC-type Zn-finger protein [Trachipleistophora hominis]